MLGSRSWCIGCSSSPGPPPGRGRIEILCAAGAGCAEPQRYAGAGRVAGHQGAAPLS